MNAYYTVAMYNNSYGILIEQPKDSKQFTLMFTNLSEEYAKKLVEVLNKKEPTKV